MRIEYDMFVVVEGHYAEDVIEIDDVLYLVMRQRYNEGHDRTYLKLRRIK